MMFMQGFFDDSGSSQLQDVFVLAGLVSWSENWAAFADEWDNALHEAPRIEFFKSNQAARLEGEFEGWTRAAVEEKKIKLADIARKHSMLRVCIQMRWADFVEQRKELEAMWPSAERLPPIFAESLFPALLQCYLLPRSISAAMGLEYGDELRFRSPVSVRRRRDEMLGHRGRDDAKKTQTLRRESTKSRG